MELQQIRQLSRIDWDFISSNPNTNPSLHWYPGTFVPELPGALIDVLSEPRSRVFDPYGGVGTTGLSALVRGRSVVCCDFNPIAVLSSYVSNCLLLLCSARQTSFDALFAEVGNNANIEEYSTAISFRDELDIDEVIASLADPPPAKLLSTLQVAGPVVADLADWYAPETLDDLLKLLAAASDTQRPAFNRLVSLAMISSIARQLSSQTRSWGHIADRVFPKQYITKTPRRSAHKWLNRVQKKIRAIARRSSFDNSSRVLNLHAALHDWGTTETFTSPKCDLLVTSPPYAGAIDYVLAQRLSLSLLGFSSDDIARMTKQEFGARRKRFDKTHTTSWAQNLADATNRQLTLMNDAAFAAFLLPHKDFGRQIGETYLRAVMLDNNWSLVFERDRSIRQLKARQSWTSIKRETLCVFRKQ